MRPRSFAGARNLAPNCHDAWHFEELRAAPRPRAPAQSHRGVASLPDTAGGDSRLLELMQRRFPTETQTPWRSSTRSVVTLAATRAIGPARPARSQSNDLPDFAYSHSSPPQRAAQPARSLHSHGPSSRSWV